MTAEHLLDAIGLLDDSLIQDAEARPAPVVPLSVRFHRWGSLAACLAVVLVIGYGVTHLRMGSSSNSSGAPASSGGVDIAEAVEPSASSSSTSNAGTWDSADTEALGDSTGSSGSNVLETGLIYTDSGVYSISGAYAEALPEDSRDLGVLSALSPDAPSPSTGTEAYAGCHLWEAPDGTLYVQLPAGGYAVAELVQP